MKQNTLSRIQIIVAIVVAIYVVMPDFFIGPIDDAAVAAIAGIVEVVLAVRRAVPNTNADPERGAEGYANDEHFDGYDTY